MLDAPTVGHRAGDRKKQNISSWNECIGQAIRLHFNVNIFGERGLANIFKHSHIDNPIFSKPGRPNREVSL